MTRYLIWSNQRRMWWRANQRGYTPFIEEAGRYPHEQATTIVEKSTLGGQLNIPATDPVTGLTYQQADERLVLAPEHTDTLLEQGRAEGRAAFAEELATLRQVYDAVEEAGHDIGQQWKAGELG